MAEALEVAMTIQPEKYPISRNFVVLQILLRLLAGIATFAAAVVMVADKQTVTYFGLTITAKYTYSEAFEFFVAANWVAFAYSLLSSGFFMLKSSSSKTKSQFIIFLLDMIMVALLISGCSAAAAFGYVAKYGNAHTGWVELCRYMGTFCNVGIISIVLSFSGFLVFYLLAAITMKGPRQIPVASC